MDDEPTSPNSINEGMTVGHLDRAMHSSDFIQKGLTTAHLAGRLENQTPQTPTPGGTGEASSPPAAPPAKAE